MPCVALSNETRNCSRRSRYLAESGVRNPHEERQDIPSLAIVQGEIARFYRTGSLLHLARAQRALEDARRELACTRERARAGILSISSLVPR